MGSAERDLEQHLIDTLRDLKYDVRDRAALEANFRKHFQALSRCRLSDAEFDRLLSEIVTQDVFTAGHTFGNRNSFTRDNGTPLSRALVRVGENAYRAISMLNSPTPN